MKYEIGEVAVCSTFKRPVGILGYNEGLKVYYVYDTELDQVYEAAEGYLEDYPECD